MDRPNRIGYYWAVDKESDAWCMVYWAGASALVYDVELREERIQEKYRDFRLIEPPKE